MIRHDAPVERRETTSPIEATREHRAGRTRQARRSYGGSIVALAASSIFAVAMLGCASPEPAAQPDAYVAETPPPPAPPPAHSAVVPDASVPDAKDASPPYLGEPIVVPPTDFEKWVWIPIPETRCADDTPAGVGVNFTSQSRELLVYFQGNGVCYDSLTCTLFKDLLVGMGDDPLDHMWWGNKGLGESGIFDRKADGNPFRKSNYVVFPHCAIDAHTSDQDTEYPGIGVVHQHGYRNVTEALKRIVPTFADASRIVLAGYSAGGIGVTANYHQIATAFAVAGQPPPFLINDAGPIMRPPYLEDGAQAKLRKGWGLEKTVGTFCPKCITEGMHSIYEANAALHPGVHSSQLCAYEDVTVTMLYRLLNGDVNLFDNDRMKRGLLDHAEWLAGRQVVLSPSVHRSFFYKGADHGTLFGTFAEKPDLISFLNDQLSASPTWPSYTP